MKKITIALLCLLSPMVGWATVPLTLVVTPHGAGLLDTGTSTVQLTATCTYSVAPFTDNCAAAGTITWASHGQTTLSSLTAASVSATGLVTWLTPVNFTEYYEGTFKATSAITATVTGACNGSATRCQDYMTVQGQHNGDAWNVFVTPGVQIFNNIGTPSLNMVVGSSGQLGCGYTLNGGSSANPCQTCNYTASNGNFTVDRNGKVTAVSPGSTTFTCNMSGHAVTSGGSPTQTLTAVTVSNPTPTTWYIRDDGGTPYSATNTAGRCNGKFDAADPGSGTNQNCAFKDYEYLYFDQVTHLQALWLITGGDTVIIRKPTHGLTYHSALINQSGYIPTNCNSNQVYNGCDVPNIPSGPDASHPTRILGENYASCDQANGPDPSKIVNITNWGRSAIVTQISQNVEIRCLSFTDDGTFHSGNGVWQSALTSNVLYKDVLFYHNFTGVWGPQGIGVTFDHVSVDQNPHFGINMDDAPSYPGGLCGGVGCQNTSGAGDFTMTNSTIQYTGCYGIGANDSCFGHDYDSSLDPDGLAEGNMIGNFTMDNTIVRYNIEDGADFLHATMQNVSITNSQFYGNIGQQAKIGPADNTTLRNNTFIGNCNRLKEPLNGFILADPATLGCRAGGAPVNPAIGGGVYKFQSNTFVGVGNVIFLQGCAYGWTCFDPQSTTTWQDNIGLGYKGSAAVYQSGTTPPMFGTTGINNVCSNNSYFGVNNTGTACTSDSSADPLLAGEVAAPPGTTLVGAGESVLDNFDFSLTSSSPPKWTGVAYTGQLTNAQNGIAWHAPPSMGAFEFNGAATVATPTFSPVAGTYSATQSVSISTVTGGASIVYTNNGTTPTVSGLTCTISNGTLYAGAISVPASITLKAIGCLAADNPSSPATAVYTIIPPSSSSISGSTAVGVVIR